MDHHIVITSAGMFDTILFGIVLMPLAFGKSSQHSSKQVCCLMFGWWESRSDDKTQIKINPQKIEGKNVAEWQNRRQTANNNHTEGKQMRIKLFPLWLGLDIDVESTISLHGKIPKIATKMQK